MVSTYMSTTACREYCGKGNADKACSAAELMDHSANAIRFADTDRGPALLTQLSVPVDIRHMPKGCHCLEQVQQP